MGFVIVIPARYASTRLPAKPLALIAGKPLIEHVYRRALQCAADAVVIATDDARIGEIAQSFGADVCMTSAAHPSGTDRLAEVAAMRGYGDDQIIVNLQGDEPLMPPAVLRQVAQNLADHPSAVMATVCETIRDARLIGEPSVVKVVMDRHGYALYFSRAPIPFDRDAFAGSTPSSLSSACTHYRHLGVYAYRAGFLRAYTQWGPCALEQAEKLEQLRALWHGCKIHVAEAVEPVPVGVDTPEDLQRVRRVLDDAR